MEENGENNYTLTIHNIRERNLGNYTCQAVNKIGDGSSTISLKGQKVSIYLHTIINTILAKLLLANFMFFVKQHIDIYLCILVVTSLMQKYFFANLRKKLMSNESISIFHLGIPFDLNFHSSSTGRYKTHYNLSWTLKSFVPIQKTELQYKRKVSTGWYKKWLFSLFLLRLYEDKITARV